MSNDLKQAGRVAFREEGQFWNAYYALPDTMEGAVLMASVNINIVRGNKKYKDAFMALMRTIVGDFLKDTTGASPIWKDPILAPERERTKE